MARPTARVLSLLELLQSGGVRLKHSIAHQRGWLHLPGEQAAIAWHIGERLEEIGCTRAQ